jgi:hypothetical protein
MRRLRLAGHAHALDGSSRVGRAQSLSARLGGRQCHLGALRDRLALVLGDSRQDVDGELVGVRSEIASRSCSATAASDVLPALPFNVKLFHVF